jgi:hypothetical protein
MELDNTFCHCKKRIIATSAYLLTGVDAGTTLTHYDFATEYFLAIEELDAQPFTMTISIILCRPTGFTCCHLRILVLLIY